MISKTRNRQMIRGRADPLIRAILFDLDDTLYPEGDFYRSGFRVVARALEKRGVEHAAKIQAALESIHFHESRERVLNRAALCLGFPESWVPELVDLFHSHRPQIGLEASTIEVLARLRITYQLGIVTDGHARVQRNKIDALGVVDLVDCIILTDELGRDHWKPSPLPFHLCCDRLGVDPSQAVAVGDNPARDMQGARNANIGSIRMKRSDGYFSDQQDPRGERADHEVASLVELEDLLNTMNPKAMVA